METPFTPTMTNSPFHFYSPDSQQERHYGQFSPCPSVPSGMPFYPHIVKTPGVNYVQHFPMPDASTVFQRFPKMPTPLASPQPLYPSSAVKGRQLSFLQLDTDFGPSTPPLSASGSASSSPPTAYPMLVTPASHSFVPAESMYGSKFDMDSFGDVLPLNDWLSPSPPHTPVFTFPLAEPARSPATDEKAKLSNSVSPSSLSFSLSAEPDDSLSFCDPRQLTVHSPILLPTPLSAVSQSSSSSAVYNPSTAINCTQPQIADFIGSTGLPNCDTLFGLDFDPEFSNFSKSGITDSSFFTSHKRQRTQLASFISEEDPFLSEDSFSDVDEDQLAAAWLSTPSELDGSFHSDMSSTASTSSQDFSSNESPEVDSEADYTAANGVTENSTSNASTDEQTPTGNNDEGDSPMPSASKHNSGDDTPGSVRRGRKQSLTDDPSKTFICHLCNRRFRRQEHLKRHYRSLHTHDKPFKCGDCGKQFSRSDNLAQHQRTHGIGVSLEMGDTEGEGQEGAGSPVSDSDRMAQILYQAAQKLAKSTSESSASSTEESERSVSVATPEKKMRKRKREE